MIDQKIIIATHGNFGAELINSAEMIIGKMENIISISLTPEKSFEQFMEEAESLLKEEDGSIKTFVFVDIFGGTPSNVFTALTRKYNHQVIAGLNLPILIDFYLKIQEVGEWSINKESEIVKQILKTGTESIINTNELIES